jgi:hypothetical protein
MDNDLTIELWQGSSTHFSHATAKPNVRVLSLSKIIHIESSYSGTGVGAISTSQNRSPSPDSQSRNTTLILNPWRAQLQQLPKVRCPIPSYRIPALSSVPARTRNHRASIRRNIKPTQTIATRRLSIHDIIQAELSHGINPRVQEPQSR